ncbi:MAG: LytTR family DNA-binding domain-containing protein [Oscillospiraceae bacterium]|nr:LytTR family DNA-binding domain-containing protein [Oscillospiraceae bacterium]
MLHVVICDDNPTHRVHLEEIVRKFICAEGLHIKLALSTGNPIEVVRRLNERTEKGALYFIDVELQHDINGIELAALIRNSDVNAKIVFVTSHRDPVGLIFKYKIEALDYIVKGMQLSLEKSMIECLTVAYKRHLDEKHSKLKYFSIEAKGEVWNVLIDDILFFRTHPTARNKMIVHMKSSQVEFRCTIGEIEDIGPDFYRCHQSCIVNIRNIARLDKTNKVLEMITGEAAPIAVRSINGLKAKLLHSENALVPIRKTKSALLLEEIG